MAKPFLKWVGGKRQLLPKILELVPPTFGTYHEPFVGGGALFFALEEAGRIEQAYLSDANLNLIRAYKGIVLNVDTVLDHLRRHQELHCKDHFEAVKKLDPLKMNLTEAAAWMIYLNRTCFNGLYRVNAKGRFNVAFGDYENPKIVDEEGLKAVCQALKTVCISHIAIGLDVGLFRPLADGGDTQLFASMRPGDFAYFDPPYIPLTETANFTSYTADGFDHASQVYLRDRVLELKRRGVHVLVSNSDTPVTRLLYQEKDGFELHEVTATRNVNSKGSARGRVGELLIR